MHGDERRPEGELKTFELMCLFFIISLFIIDHSLYNYQLYVGRIQG